MPAKGLKRGSSDKPTSDGESKTKIVVDTDKLTKKTNAPKKCPNPGGKEIVWNNKNLEKIKDIEVEIPISLVYVMRQISEKMTTDSEFGLYLKGEFVDRKLIVSEEYYVPKQKVSRASIDFDDEDGGPEWNGVIHKHPTGCTGFSGTDDGSINSNHLFSLLFESNQIKSGEINLTVKEILGRIRLPLDLTFRHPEIDVPDNLIEKIDDKPAYATYHHSNQQGQYGYQNYNRNHNANGYSPQGHSWWDTVDEEDRIPTIAHGQSMRHANRQKQNTPGKNHTQAANKNKPARTPKPSTDPSDVAARNTDRLKKVFGEDFDPANLSDWDQLDMFTQAEPDAGEVSEESSAMDELWNRQLD